ncbi:MAG: THUMP domain-containing protein [Nitrospiraceae bacterium]
MAPKIHLRKRATPTETELVQGRFFAPCPRGLESILEQELHGLDIPDTTRTDGGVGFSGSWATMTRANLHSRIASRILWEISRAHYRTESDIYEAALAIPWPTWFTPDDTIKVKISAQRCPLKSLDFLTLRIKDAVCDAFRNARLKRPSVDTNKPDVRIDAFLDARTLTLYLDTTGDPLFRRGHRLHHVDAPLRENLAAGLLQLSAWTPDIPLLDPMCGGGTISVEAASIAAGIAPGLSRQFAFEKWLTHDRTLWERQRAQARAQQTATSAAAPSIVASDIDPSMVAVAQRVFDHAGVADRIQLSQQDVLTVTPPEQPGVIILNPPYGERIGATESLRAFYPELGNWLKQRCAGWRAYILTGDAELQHGIGLTPTKRIPLYNGPIECRVYEFIMVEGSARRRLAPIATTDPHA